tara:strand:+ start:24982 stop:25662 length:681 start_codon:yes stop_codon:yes gene_type:complete
MKSHKYIVAIVSISFFIGSHTTLWSQIESMNPRNDNNNASFNIPSNSNSPNETFEFINPKNEEEKFEQALERMMKQQIADQELKDLNNKGIVDKEAFYRKRLQAEMDGLTNSYAIINQDLGGFSTRSKSVTIVCRDFAYPDGDVVSIILNDEPVIRFIELTQSYQSFTLPLEPGLNTISFKALNQGTSGPNTAGFMIFDDAGNVLSSNQWNLATGASAILSIARDN